MQKEVGGGVNKTTTDHHVRLIVLTPMLGVYLLWSVVTDTNVGFIMVVSDDQCWGLLLVPLTQILKVIVTAADNNDGG